MIRLTLTAVLLLSTAVCFAQPAPPAADVKVKVGRPFQFTLPKDTGYEPAFDQSKCRLARLYSEEAGEILLEIWPFEPGTYPIVTWNVGDKRGRMTKYVTDEAPPPPGPPPPPPAPPFPPEYRTKLQAAFAADAGTAAEKENNRRILRIMFTAAVDAKIALDPTVIDAPQLTRKMKETAEKMTDDALVGTRTTIGELIAAVVPFDAPLTDANRQAAHALFRQISAALSW